MKTLGDRLKYARECKGVSQLQVSKDLGINNKSLSGYERNVAEPDIELLKKLSNYYNMDINYIIGDAKEDIYKNSLIEELKKYGYDYTNTSIEDMAKLVVKAIKIDEINKSN